MIEGLGLTTSELMLARTSAIKHAGRRDKPARLVDLMTRFGIDFLTLTALTAEQAQGLRRTSTDRWQQLLLQSPPTSEEDEAGSSSGTESQLSVGWDTAGESQTLPPGGPGTEGHDTAVRQHMESLLRRFVSTTTVIEELGVGAGPGPGTEPQRQSRRGRQSRQGPQSGSSGYRQSRRPTARRRTVLPQETSTSRVSGQEPGEASPPPPPAGDPRRALLALPGIRASRLPSEESLDRLERFLRANQPCDPTPVSCNENKRNESLKES